MMAEWVNRLTALEQRVYSMLRCGLDQSYIAMSWECSIEDVDTIASRILDKLGTEPITTEDLQVLTPTQRAIVEQLLKGRSPAEISAEHGWARQYVHGVLGLAAKRLKKNIVGMAMAVRHAERDWVRRTAFDDAVARISPPALRDLQAALKGTVRPELVQHLRCEYIRVGKIADTPTPSQISQQSVDRKRLAVELWNAGMDRIELAAKLGITVGSLYVMIGELRKRRPDGVPFPALRRGKSGGK